MANGRRSASTTSRRAPGSHRDRKRSGAVRAPARVRRRARDTRVSRRARATTARAAASRSSKAARCRSRAGCRSAASRIRSARRRASSVSTSSRLVEGEVTPEALRDGGLDRSARAGEGAGERRDLDGGHGARPQGERQAPARRSSRPAAASRSNVAPSGAIMAQNNAAQAVQNIYQHAGAEGQDPLHAPVPVDLPDRRAHHGAGRGRRRADGLLPQSAERRRAARPVRPVHRRRSCRARRCSRSASCRTSRPASSSRSPAR